MGTPYGAIASSPARRGPRDGLQWVRTIGIAEEVDVCRYQEPASYVRGADLKTTDGHAVEPGRFFHIYTERLSGKLGENTAFAFLNCRQRVRTWRKSGKTGYAVPAGLVASALSEARRNLRDEVA